MDSLWAASPGSPDLVARARAAEAIEAAAWADSFSAIADTDLGGETVEIAGATAMRMQRLPMAFFSKVLGLGMHRPATRSDVEAILSWYRDAGFSKVWFQPSPAAEPDGLLGLLDSCGIRPVARRWAKFVRGPGAVAQARSSLEVREADAARADDFATVALEGFDLPAHIAPWLEALPDRAGWRCYVAYDGAEPVACGACFIRDGVAFIGFGSTRPAYRRRGGQSALLARRIADATAAGAQLLVTETGSDDGEPGPSLRNIRRMGFELLYVRPNCAPTE